MMTAPGLLLLGAPEGQDMPQSDAWRLFWLPPYAAILALSVWRRRDFPRLWLPALCCLALVGWAAASRFWSIDPATTDRRVAALAFTTLFGLYLAAAFEGARLPRLIAGSCLILAVASLATVLVLPRYGVHGAGLLSGDWRGVWGEKNTLGLVMAIGAVASLSVMTAARRWSPIWTAGLALCGFLLVMSDSKTSLLCLLAALPAAGALYVARRGRVLAGVAVWCVSAAVVLLGAVAWLAPALILKALGKDPTLTGRTEIWDAIFRQVPQSPYLGFGYSVFWGPGSGPAQWVRSETGWIVPSAHNGWLDLLVQLGWIGVGLFAAVFILAAVSGLVRHRRLQDGDLTVLFLLIFAVQTMTESVIQQHNSLVWAMFVAALARATSRAPPGDGAVTD